MKKFFSEFKAFISKGNVIDMAVAVVIGGGFSKIVTSLVNDVIMPLISMLTGGLSVSEWKYVITPAVLDEAGAVITPEVAFMYGNFIQNVVNFLLVAFVIFVMIRFINNFRRKKEEAPKAPPAPSKEEVLLTEIRDLLKEKK